MAEIDVVTLSDNKKSGKIKLSAIFDVALRKDILNRVINWQLAKRQRGTHKTKGISEIQGTTAKPYRQKGTGNARQGSLRSPQFRGGAVIFGPVVRSHAHKLPKRVRKLGLKVALSAKLKDKQLIIIKDEKLKESKTASLAKQLKPFELKSALVIGGNEVDENFAKASSNLKGVSYLPQQGANVYDIVKHDTLILTEEAVKLLEERLA